MTMPATRVATLRILVGGYAVAYLLVRAPHFWEVFGLEERRWEPVGVLGWMDAPVPAGAARALLVATILLGVGFVTGARFRVVAPAFAALFLLTTTVRNSWGQVWHTENLVVVHVAVLAFAPGAVVWSIDARRRAVSREIRTWAPVVMSWATVTTYVLAGVTKLRDAGPGWVTGDTLRNQVAFDNVRKAALGADGSPIAGTVLDHAWLLALFAVVTLVVELGAPVALCGGRWAAAWTVTAWAFHVGVLALMAIGFPYQLTGIAFASLFPVERAVERAVEHAHAHRRAPGALAPTAPDVGD
ncbi:MAG: hypothetical protein KatS3mg010_1596 [Acidimicrobiia bacterium]|nr:MAG: hypothetical protein KatS3mg010_1596 [Acidimicrobiia bacterium]